MSQLVPLKQKIRSIQTTKKITHAVRLVSMSFYNKLDKLNVPLKKYTKTIKDLFLTVLSHAPEWQSPLLFPQDIFDSMPLYIVISTSKGLCGSLNSNLFRYIEKSVFIEKQQIPQFIAIGQKAITFVKDGEFRSSISTTYPELSSNNFIAIADDLVDKIIKGDIRYSSVTFYTSEAKSFFVQRPYKFTLIPMSLDPMIEVENKPVGTDEVLLEDDPVINQPIWEQQKSDVLDFLSIRYLRSAIIHVLFQALRAEHAARFLAMENSTNNAEKYLERLTLQFNKLRQSLITKEVSELTSSFPTR
jgi:F-type H+-transporting ATPase subunit gamma